MIPLRERTRLGVAAGGTLELIATAEGVLLERRRAAEVVIGAHDVPLAVVEDGGSISNEESIGVIHHDRERW